MKKHKFQQKIAGNDDFIKRSQKTNSSKDYKKKRKEI